jgi:hypothetical protein
VTWFSNAWRTPTKSESKLTLCLICGSLCCLPISFEQKYYPPAILLIFMLLAGPRIGMILGLVIGYVESFGYLDRIILGLNTAIITEQKASCTKLSGMKSKVIFHLTCFRFCQGFLWWPRSWFRLTSTLAACCTSSSNLLRSSSDCGQWSQCFGRRDQHVLSKGFIANKWRTKQNPLAAGGRTPGSHRTLQEKALLVQNLGPSQIEWRGNNWESRPRRSQWFKWSNPWGEWRSI